MAETTYKSAADILALDDIPTKEVHVPEWGTTVRLRGMTGAERDRLEASLVEQKGQDIKQNLEDYRAKIIIATAVDEKGYPLFEAKHIKKLSGKSAKALDRLADEGAKLSGMSQEDVEELTKPFD